MLLTWYTGEQECKQRKVVEGLRLCKDTKCNDYGSATQGDLVFTSCNTNWHHMHVFIRPPNSAGSLATLVSGVVVEGTCIRQDVEMYQCQLCDDSSSCIFKSGWTSTEFLPLKPWNQLTVQEQKEFETVCCTNGPLNLTEQPNCQHQYSNGPDGTNGTYANEVASTPGRNPFQFLA